jgi:hypothetical protein
MMLVGRIGKAEGPWWFAECAIVGAHTQGKSRKDARQMLADCIETLLDRDSAKVTVAEIGQDDDGTYVVRIDSTEPARLAALVLTVQREHNKLSLADVAAKLGVSSRNAYARYEQGASVPTLDKYIELLAAVAPDMALMVGPRATKRKAKAG